jgi:hypothetical protein
MQGSALPSPSLPHALHRAFSCMLRLARNIILFQWVKNLDTPRHLKSQLRVLYAADLCSTFYVSDPDSIDSMSSSAMLATDSLVSLAASTVEESKLDAGDDSDTCSDVDVDEDAMASLEADAVGSSDYRPTTSAYELPPLGDIDVWQVRTFINRDLPFKLPLTVSGAHDPTSSEAFEVDEYGNAVRRALVLNTVPGQV